VGGQPNGSARRVQGPVHQEGTAAIQNAHRYYQRGGGYTGTSKRTSSGLRRSSRLGCYAQTVIGNTTSVGGMTLLLGCYCTGKPGGARSCPRPSEGARQRPAPVGPHGAAFRICASNTGQTAAPSTMSDQQNGLLRHGLEKPRHWDWIHEDSEAVLYRRISSTKDGP